MTNLDLFGNPVPAPVPEADKVRAARRRQAQPRGFAGTPGTGPEGETCGSCAHIRRLNEGGNRTYPKCYLMSASWGKSARTDILVRSPACYRWQEGGDK